MKTTRTATIQDFKIGTTLITSEGYEFTLRNKYSDGVWESKDKLHFVSEAKHYQVKI